MVVTECEQYNKVSFDSFDNGFGKNAARMCTRR